MQPFGPQSYFSNTRQKPLLRKSLSNTNKPFRPFSTRTEGSDLKAKLESVQSKVETILGHRAYTAEQVQLVMNHQSQKMAFSTELAYRCGLRAHELLTIERASDKPADKRFYSDGREKNLSSKFDGMGEGVRYVVTGKGGLTREIFVPKNLAEKLEQKRLQEPVRVRDRGVFYVQKYDLSGGKKFTDSFAKASERALGWSTGAHGLRHSYAQERLKNLTKNYDYETAKETALPRDGHFMALDITDAICDDGFSCIYCRVAGRVSFKLF